MRVSPAEAIQLLQQGEVVAIPTETVYGLAADARNETAIAKIYATKQRPADNPLIVHLADRQQMHDWAAEVSPLAHALAEAFWPGPLTLVLPAHASVPLMVRAYEPTVALRVPSHPVAREILLGSGLGLAAPSANKYTQLSPTTAAHVTAGLGVEIPVVEGGACEVGIESTIVSVSGDTWQLLRPGMITVDSLTAIAGKPPQQQATTPKAPGQHLLHYSPRTPSLLLPREALMQRLQVAPGAVALLFGEALPTAAATHCIVLPASPAAAAEQLYAALHTLDALHAPLLLIELPPAQPAWAAVQDRLQRAAYQPDTNRD